ncbi:MAG: ABC transporter ATP-binding protein [candidate division NC10 bacterium]|nr:ABC transporter ATP-binding protein [candidate division NC10 bacterium]
MRVIETENLTKEYRVGFWQKRVRVLSDLSLSVSQGEIFGYLGPNGAGKTTTLKLLMSLVEPTSGEARIFGRPAGDVAAKAQVGFLPEQPYFYEYLTGRELLNYYGQLAGLRRSDRRDRVAELAGRVGIDSALDLSLRKYSKGMLQRLGLAQALLHDPQLVLLDEPMSGLDPIGRREVRDLLLRLKEDGKTVFFSSHIIPDVETVCDRVGILVGGRLVAQGSLDELGDTKVGSIEVTVSHVPPDAIQELDHLLMTAPVARGDTLLLTVKDEPALADLLARLADVKAVIHAVIPQRESLEAYFLRHACPESGRRV